jgi:hypothetical protein
VRLSRTDSNPVNVFQSLIYPHHFENTPVDVPITAKFWNRKPSVPENCILLTNISYHSTSAADASEKSRAKLVSYEKKLIDIKHFLL